MPHPRIDRAARPGAAVIVVTIHDNDTHVFPALRAGATGYILRSQPSAVDVLRLIGKGYEVPEAASLLGISAHTVTSYVRDIYRKRDISSRAEAAVEAARRGLVSWQDRH